MKYFCLFALLSFLSCKNDKPEQQASLQGQDAQGLPEGFADFYQKYHGDSIFQIEHTIFPLQGLPDNADSLTIAHDNFHWQLENWKMQRAFDFQMSDFKRQIVPINDMMVLERIVHQSGEYGMVRRFAIVAGEWHLIYYAGMNRLAKQ